MKNIFKKFILLLIIVITILCVRSLLDERQSIMGLKTTVNEEFALFNTTDSEYTDLKKSFDSQPNTIQNYSGDKNLPLKEYCIKSSYNSAISGKYVSNDMIKLVISRGCRFIDLEILIVDNTPVVSHTIDKNYTSRETENTIALDSILTTIATNAFVASNPNPNDPLFIHLRVKSNDMKSLQYIAASIDSTLAKTRKLYKNDISESITLNDIMGKIVIIVDNSNIYNYNKLTKCTKDDTNCYDLSNYINSKSNNQFFNKKKIIDIVESTQVTPSFNDAGISDVKKINIGLPDTTANTGLFSFSNNIENPNIRDLVHKFGIQIVGFKFHLLDNNLIEQEEFFNIFKSAIVPFKRAMPYLNRLYE